MRNPITCDDVFSAARGDERDPPDVRAHVAACPPCRSALAGVRSLAESYRASFDPPGRSCAASVLARAARAPATAGRPWELAVATSCALALAILVLLLPAAGGPRRAPQAAARPSPVLPSPAPRQPVEARLAPPPLVLELRAAAEDRLRYVLHGPDTTLPGEVDLTTGFVLETVPADAVVVDTF
jgi:hypothetical protein